MILGQLINPKVAIKAVRTQCEKQTKQKVSDFNIIYNAKKDEIIFLINGVQYLFPSDMLRTAIKGQAEANLDPNKELTIVKLDIDKENNIDAYLYYMENGKKEFIKYEL